MERERDRERCRQSEKGGWGEIKMQPGVGGVLCGQSGSFQIPQLESPDQTEPACSFGDYTKAVEGD